jgi:transcriptional regulator with XRE-family HTH domain
MEKIERLQKNLAVIRKVAGWSAEELAEMLGVTRQTIVNLENSDTHSMTKIQYIAIRALLEAEICNSKNDTLAKVINILVDKEEISEQIKEDVRDVVSTTTNSLGRRVGSAAGGTAAVKALLPILAPVSTPILGAAIFAVEILKDLEKRKRSNGK